VCQVCVYFVSGLLCGRAFAEQVCLGVCWRSTEDTGDVIDDIRPVSAPKHFGRGKCLCWSLDRKVTHRAVTSIFLPNSCDCSWPQQFVLHYYPVQSWRKTHCFLRTLVYRCIYRFGVDSISCPRIRYVVGSWHYRGSYAAPIALRSLGTIAAPMLLLYVQPLIGAVVGVVVQACQGCFVRLRGVHRVSISCCLSFILLAHDLVITHAGCRCIFASCGLFWSLHVATSLALSYCSRLICCQRCSTLDTVPAFEAPFFPFAGAAARASPGPRRCCRSEPCQEPARTQAPLAPSPFRGDLAQNGAHPRAHPAVSKNQGSCVRGAYRGDCGWIKCLMT
jgi:hypothetical protein